EWVHVQLHQQKGMISLSPPTICNSAEINQVANSPGIGSSSTRWPISYVRNQATLCEILAAIPRDYVIFLT
ncbi:hypothetical protein LN031_27155, partial [Klebsiella pneumoniae]